LQLQLRIAYAGRELNCNDTPFCLNPNVSVLHVVRRMQGGSPAAELAKQMRRLMTNPIPGISVGPSEDDVLKWYVKVWQQASAVLLDLLLRLRLPKCCRTQSMWRPPPH
jgi:hypothetical protein